MITYLLTYGSRSYSEGGASN